MLLFLFFLVCESTLLGSLVPNNETSPSKNVMKQIMTDPKKFVAEVSKVDPEELAYIIQLLEGLLETSEGQEQDLVDKVNEETAKALESSETLVNALTDVENAQAALELAQQEHQAASDAHDAQEEAKALAEQEHADLEGALNGEQEIIMEVIAMLKGLHPTYQPSGWTLLYRQTHPFYQPVDNWANPLGSPEDDNYSILGDLEQYRGADGKFEFRLDWPQGGRLSQHWKQTSNPLEGAPHSGVEGYEPIDAPYSDNGWEGLEHGGTASLFDGTNNHGNWYYAVGSNQQWGCGIPGRSECETQAELWVLV